MLGDGSGMAFEGGLKDEKRDVMGLGGIPGPWPCGRDILGMFQHLTAQRWCLVGRAETSRSCSWTGRLEPNIALEAVGGLRGVLSSD